MHEGGLRGPLLVQEAPPFFTGGWRWCPTLPHPGECSTIGVSRLSFRVRNGTGRFPGAMTTATTIGLYCHVCATRGVVLGNRRADASMSLPPTIRGCCLIGDRPLVPVSFTRYRASTSGLSTPWSLGGLHQQMLEGELVLKQASRLDAFSGYPSRT